MEEKFSSYETNTIENRDKASHWVQLKLSHSSTLCAVNELSILHCWGTHVSGMEHPGNLIIY